MQISTIINDYQKFKIINNSVYEFIRIHTSALPDIINLENIKQNAYTPNYNIEFKQKIISKEKFVKYKNTKGQKKLERYVSLLYKFIKELHFEFPIPPCYENINNIKNLIFNCACRRSLGKSRKS